VTAERRIQSVESEEIKVNGSGTLQDNETATRWPGDEGEAGFFKGDAQGDVVWWRAGPSANLPPAFLALLYGGC